MILKELTIEQFGKIEYFNVSFRDRVTVIAVPDAEGIAKAIGLATNNKSLTDRSGIFAVSDNTKILLRLEIAGHPYAIAARGQSHCSECIYEAADCKTDAAVDASSLFGDMRLCEEEESLIYYRYNPKNAFSTRLLHYKYPEKYYASGDFQRKTNGYGSTQTFRIYLKEFIRKHGIYGFFTDLYKNEPRSDKSLIGLCPTLADFPADLNEQEKKLFDYYCYVEVNELWSGFEDIRDMNHEKWPMLIDAGDMHEDAGFCKMLAKTEGLGRQMVVMHSQCTK